MGDRLIVDMNAYVAPGLELIYERAPGELRGAWESLQKFMSVAHPQREIGDRDFSHLTLTFGGERPRSVVWDDPAMMAASSDRRPVEPGILHDNAAGRLLDLDRDGIDVQLLNPGSTLAATRWLPSNLGAGVLGAFNQYLLAYCAEDPARLKAVVQLHGGEPEWSASELRELADNPAVAAASLWLPGKVAPDDRRFLPIWHVLEETGVPLVHRPSVCNPVWDNRRMLAFLAHAKILQRFPAVRMAFVGDDVAWVDGWVEHIEKSVPDAPLRRWADEGRLFATVGVRDTAETISRAAVELGERTLLWHSEFPYRSATPPAAPIDYGANAMRFMQRSGAEAPLAH